MSDSYNYWEGTILCPRKGLSHISRDYCLQLYGVPCGSCRGRDEVLKQIKEEDEQEEERRQECKEMSSRRGSKKPSTAS